MFRHFDIRPEASWGDYARNGVLADHIYNLALSRVNEQDWAYINPASGIGIFEDAAGNYLCLETADEGATNVIQSMHCGLEDETPSEMKQFIDQFVTDFDLIVALKEDT
tara:strand:+ start:300 stop:626 length:327 start_codon:yes stop_codon:yes gene_type:complete